MRPYIMPDGSIIFKGRNTIFRPCPRIDASKIRFEYFEVPAEDESIPEVDSRVEAIIKGIINGFPLKQAKLNDLAIAVSEAVTNAIRHGPQGSDRRVGVNVMYIPGVMLYIFVRDNLGELKCEDLNFEVSETFDTDQSGRGMLIMTHLCSVVAYHCDNASRVSSNEKEVILGFELGNDD